MYRVFVRVLLAVGGLALWIAASPAPKPSRPLVVALGDSITYGYGLASRTTQNYAALYAASVGGRVVDLGQPGFACADVLKDEVPHMPSGAAVVIVNCGINDVGGFDFTPARVTRFPAVSDTELASSEKSFAALLVRVRAKEPHATLYLVNLRHWQRIDGPEPHQFAKDVDAWNAMLTATHLHVVDICDDARMYDRANFRSDEIHPNVRGSEAIASDFAAAAPATRRCGGAG
jgi:lysophospholipase L1-like esterase